MSLRSGLLIGLTAIALLVAPTAAAEPPVAVQALQPPGIAGTPQVGSTLTVQAPVWSQDGVVTDYQWLRNEEPIPAATGVALALTAVDLNAAIAVQATGTLAGFADGVSTSEPTVLIALGTIAVVQGPVINGTVAVGSTLAASAPTWSVDEVTTGYQWLRDGSPIPGATSNRRTLATADIGSTIAVRATGTKEGYNAARATSAATTRIGKIRPLVTVRGTSSKVGALSLSITVAASPDSPPSGTVQVLRGTKVLKAKLALTRGTARYTATGIKPGRSTYTVRYAATARIASGSGSAAVQIRAKTRPAIRVTAKAAPAKVSLAISVSAAGQPPLGGTAYVREGAKTLKSKIRISKGKATWSASGVKPGRHTYRIGYDGTSQVSTGSTTVTVKVPAPVKLVSYANCAAMQMVHPHGVGRTGAKDSTSGKPVTTFLVHTKLYEYNDGKARRKGEKDLDRDNDGVACEKH